MGTTERRQLEREFIKKKILEAASDILAKEGYENLSMRKIAKRIEYSPGIIYHYFKDKDEIITLIVEEGYGKILKTISKIPVDIEKGIFREMDVELTAQIIWTSTYGLLSRLILEKNISKKQKDRLIDHHFQILINGLLK